MTALKKHLYLIGNGFDRHHDIPSGYESFKEWLKSHNRMLYMRLFLLYEINGGNLWASFEENLGNITADSIIESLYPNPLILVPQADGQNYLSIDCLDETATEVGYSLSRLYIDLQVAFEDWIEHLSPPDLTKKVRLDNGNLQFVNFNYTPTLEKLYGIDSASILYIHGCATRHENLIFGHNKTKEMKLAEWGETHSEEELDSLEEAADEIAAIYKDTSKIITPNQAFWESIRDVEVIHIWGLSLSDVDLPYFEHILSLVNLPEVKFEFSWLTDNDKNHIKEIIERYGIQKHSLVQLDKMIE